MSHLAGINLCKPRVHQVGILAFQVQPLVIILLVFYHQDEEKAGKILLSQMELLIFQMPLKHHLREMTYSCLEKY